jgi:DNA-binding response OmpR family regulator
MPYLHSYTAAGFRSPATLRVTTRSQSPGLEPGDLPGRFRDRPAGRIALLDDHSDLVYGLRDYFRLAGYSAAAFTTAAALSEELGRATFDVFILDWTLEEGTSEQLILDILALSGDASLFLLSGNVGLSPEDARKLSQLKLRGVRVCEKPIRPSALRSLVDLALTSMQPQR